MDRQQIETTLADYLDRDTMLIDTERLERDLDRHLMALEAIYTYRVVDQVRDENRELLQAAWVHNDLVVSHRGGQPRQDPAVAAVDPGAGPGGAGDGAPPGRAVV